MAMRTNAFATLAVDSGSEDEERRAPAARKARGDADPTKGRGRAARLRRKRRAAAAAAARVSAEDVARAFDTVTANVGHALSYGSMHVYLMDVVEVWSTRTAAPRRFVDVDAHHRVVVASVAALRQLLTSIAGALTVDGVTHLVTLKPMTMTMAGYHGPASRYRVRVKDFLRVTRKVVRRVRDFTRAPASYADDKQVAALIKAAAVAEAEVDVAKRALAVLEVAASRRRKAAVAQRRAAERGLVTGKALQARDSASDAGSATASVTGSSVAESEGSKVEETASNKDHKVAAVEVKTSRRRGHRSRRGMRKAGPEHASHVVAKLCAGIETASMGHGKSGSRRDLSGAA